MNIFFFQRVTVFTVGFIIGFTTVFLSESINHIFKSPRLVVNNDLSKKNTWNIKNSSKSLQNYDKWYGNQNILTSKINLDVFAYGPQSYKNYSNYKIILESEWLKNRIPITCIIFVEKLKLANTIKETWGKHCNYLLFFSQKITDLNLPIINFKIKYTSSWQLLCETINYIWKKRYKIPLHWVIFVKDDTIVIPENLRYMLAPLDFRKPYYLGHPVILWGQSYNVAQAGYVLSYEVLKMLTRKFDSSKKCVNGGKYWKMEDYYLGKHLTSFGIHPLDTRDSQQRGTFHAFSLNILQWGLARLANYYTRALYPPGTDCCSNMTVTFNVGEAGKIRTINYILYQLQIFKDGIYGNKPAPTPIPENEVWKLALQEEFNMTVIGTMSSEEYFEIWRKKYSEPEQFMTMKFRKMPEEIKSFLDIYELQSKIAKISSVN